jgi:hypothetical protein
MFIVLRAISAAISHPKVIERFQKREWHPYAFEKDKRSQFTTMALLEMLTGYRAEYAYRTDRLPSDVIVEANGNWKEYQTGFTKKDEFLDWILGKSRNLPTANWIPTVMKSKDSGLRGMKPWPKGESFKKIYLQDTRAQPRQATDQAAPDFATQQGDGNEAYDRSHFYDELWDDPDRGYIEWICRIKVSETNMSPLEGTDLFAEYFKATDN